MVEEAAARPDAVAELVEELLRRLDADEGDWTLTLHATDGHLRKYSLEEHGGRDGLARFDEPPLRPRGC